MLSTVGASDPPGAANVASSQQHPARSQGAHPDEDIQAMNAKLSSVENLVSEVLKRTNGACASEASAVVEAAVHKARAKGKMLPHLDSDLVLSALDEVSAEMSKLGAITAANAQVMDEVAATRDADKAARDKGANHISVRSQAEEGREEEAAGGREGGADTTPVVPNPTDPMSVMSMLVEESSDAAVLGTSTASELESTAGSGEPAAPAPATAPAAAAASLMAPLRALAAIVVASHESDPSYLPFKRKLRIRKEKSADYVTAKGIDFDQCSSPRGTPHGPPMVHGHCIAYGMDPTGKPTSVEPLDKEVHQFAPMSPVFSGTRRGSERLNEELARRRSSEGSSPASGNEGSEGGFGHVVALQGDDRVSRSEGAGKEAAGQRGSPRWMPMCESTAPPGLHPTAHLEGSCTRAAQVQELGARDDGNPLAYHPTLEQGGEGPPAEMEMRSGGGSGASEEL